MNPERWERAKTIFEAALEREGAARTAFVDEACADDADVREQVLALLRGHTDAGDFLAAPTHEASGALTRGSSDRPVAAPPAEAVGTTIDRYRLLEQIGEGGFGVVYLAEQTEPVRRQVALKVIKLGMDTKQVIARFDAERQALALMDHPHIARVLDAGATEAGRPYFVMELVRGVPITRYCDEHELSMPERLALFIDVCNAVQHAHQKGVIHRDIKPGNVLVATHDGKAVPKVIDFGIAKATSQRLTEKTLFTEFRQFIGTPEYMSPEQAEMSGLDIDTRSDIYSLGVLLYELLTGTTPFAGRTLRDAAFAELQRIIREEEPPRPSTRISEATTGTMSMDDVARHRRTDATTLARALRGDLDWIIMKALEKDRTRRYDGAGAFAEDIGRHLAVEPVLAGPPSARYRLSKFARRHRAAFATGSVVTLALGVSVAAIIAALVSTKRSAADLADALALSREHLAVSQRNEQLARDAVDTYYITVSEERLLDEPGMEDLRRELLDSAGVFYARFVQEYADDPDVEQDRAFTLLRLATIKSRTDERSEAMTLLEEAEGVYAALVDRQPDDLTLLDGLMTCRLDRATLLQQDGRFDDAEMLARQCLDTLAVSDTTRPDTPVVLTLIARAGLIVGRIHYDRGDMTEAAAHWSNALAANRRLTGLEPDVSKHREQFARCHNGMGAIAFRHGRLDEVEVEYLEALRLLTQLVETSPRSQDYRASLAQQHDNIGMLYSRRGDWDAAREHHETAIDIRTRLSRDFPLYTTYRRTLAVSFQNLGVLHWRQGAYQASIDAYLRAIALIEKVVDEHPGVPEFKANLARLYQNASVSYGNLEQQAEHASMIASAIEVTEQLAAAYPQSNAYRRDLAAFRNSHGLALRAAGDTAAAADAYRRAIELHETLLRENPQETAVPYHLAEALNNLADVARETGDADESLALLDRGAALGETLLARTPDDRAVQRLLGLIYLDRATTFDMLQRPADAEADRARAETLAPEQP